MSEAVTSETDIPLMGIPEQRKDHRAEIVPFPNKRSEQLVDAFVSDINERVEHGKGGVELADHIDRLFSNVDDSSAPDYQTDLIEMLQTTDLYGNEDLYDKKEANDPVFRYLTDKLQETRQGARGLREQRQAALRLAEIRAALPAYQTESDQTWMTIIDRLFNGR